MAASPGFRDELTKAVEVFEHPELHEESAVTSFFVLLCELMDTCGITDFYFRVSHGPAAGPSATPAAPMRMASCRTYAGQTQHGCGASSAHWSTMQSSKQRASRWGVPHPPCQAGLPLVPSYPCRLLRHPLRLQIQMHVLLPAGPAECGSGAHAD